MTGNITSHKANQTSDVLHHVNLACAVESDWMLLPTNTGVDPTRLQRLKNSSDLGGRYSAWR